MFELYIYCNFCFYGTILVFLLYLEAQNLNVWRHTYNYQAWSKIELNNDRKALLKGETCVAWQNIYSF